MALQQIGAQTAASDKDMHKTPISASTATHFLSAQDVSGLVKRVGLRQFLTGMTSAITRDFLRWEAFDKTARVASHSRQGVIELMPTSDARLFSFKYVNGHPQNTSLGLPTVMAFGVLAEVATGRPLLISELTLTTAIRTAATSVIAAQALARPSSRVMALIGNGAQSEFQALAFHDLMGIEELRLFDTDSQATAKLIGNLQSNPEAKNLRITACASACDAARGADIVTTITADKANASIITSDMVEPGMHINAVGGDCPGKTEIHPDVLRMASVFVEYEPQTRIEGDLQQMPADFAVTELWRVLAGHSPGRSSETQVTLFDSVGFALEDFSALGFVYESALAQQKVRQLDLIPQLDDPKDLYALVKQAANLRGTADLIPAVAAS